MSLVVGCAPAEWVRSQLATLGLGVGKMRGSDGGWHRPEIECLGKATTGGTAVLPPPAAPSGCWRFGHRHIAERNSAASSRYKRGASAGKRVGNHRTNACQIPLDFLYISFVFPLRVPFSLTLLRWWRSLSASLHLTHTSAVLFSCLEAIQRPSSPIARFVDFLPFLRHKEIPANTSRGPPATSHTPFLYAFPCRARRYTRQDRLLLLNLPTILHAITGLSLSYPIPPTVTLSDVFTTRLNRRNDPPLDSLISLFTINTDIHTYSS